MLRSNKTSEKAICLDGSQSLERALNDVCITKQRIPLNGGVFKNSDLNFGNCKII